MKTFLHRFFGIKKNAIQKMKNSDICLFGIAILVLLALTSCALSMVAPAEWGPVVDKNQPMQFTGGANGVPSGTTITIQACNPQGNNWEDLPGGQTTSVAWKGLSGELPPPYSYWWVVPSVVIPSWYWKEG